MKRRHSPYLYWRKFAHLKIWELAALMKGIDPREMSDVTDARGDPINLDDEKRALVGAVKAQSIGASGALVNPDGQTEIAMADAIQWLYGHGYRGVAIRLDASQVSETPVGREELVSRMTSSWPTVATDVKSAGSNGLKDAAQVRHGKWDLIGAEEWARGKGLWIERSLPRTSVWSSR